MLTTLKRLYDFCGKRHSDLKKALLFSFIRCGLGVTQLLALIYTVEVLTGSMEAKSAIIKIVILTLICIAGSFVTSYVEQLSAMKTSFFMVGDKRVETGGLLRKMPLGFFNSVSSGKISSTLTTTLSAIESGGVMSLIMIVSGLFSTAAFLIFMLIYEWRVGIITALGALAYLLVVGYQIKVSRKYAPQLIKAQTGLSESTLTFLQGIKVTKSFSFADGDKNLNKAVNNSCKANLDLTNKSMPSQYLSFVTIAVFESVILLLTLYLRLVKSDISLIETIVLMVFSFMAYMSLNQAGSVLSMIGLLDTGLSEIEEIENEPVLEEKQPVETTNSNDIEFKNVSFSYGDRKVLHNISTSIKSNSLTAVIGPSGSGKTTLCQLIPRFRDIDEGVITIGGKDITHIKTEELMEKISMVFQNVYLFEDTVANNIRFGRADASMEDVTEAAKKAQCHDFIMKLPQGYDTVLQEGGNTLSGGEKQRISIARAMLKDSPIIILDEATSALDAENEHEIISAIDELTRNKTVIMIAHRLKTIENADHIIALRDGKIEEEGTHLELLKKNGLYSDFFHAREKAGSWQIKN